MPKDVSKTLLVEDFAFLGFGSVLGPIFVLYGCTLWGTGADGLVEPWSGNNCLIPTLFRIQRDQSCLAFLTKVF